MDYKLRRMLALVVIGLTVFASTLVHAQSHDHNHMDMSSMADQSQVFVCPMHPHIHGGEDDNCPICGMPLVASKVDDVDGLDEDLSGNHRVDPSLIQTIGIKTASVSLEVFGDDIRAYGRVVPSTRVESNVTLRIEGWVENFAASAIGDPIQKGQRLFNLNSPALMSAQTDYITAKKLGNDDIAKSASSRLKQLGVDKQAMELISKQSDALSSVPFHAQSSGVITKLNIRTGDYVKAGKPVLSIQDLSTVWVEADVPERDMFTLSKGDTAMVNLSETSKERTGKVTYIQPVVDPRTRTGKVRIELSNEDGSLKPDSFVDVTFTAEKKERLAVPLQAVLRSSMGDYVLRWLGEGRFKPVMVLTGVKSGKFIEVRKGLKEGDEIVTSGQFLLDAEANLKSGISSMSGHDHGGQPTGDVEHKDAEVNPHAGH